MEPADLYGLPLERFTEERNALAKRLRREGRRVDAAEVAKLRKPSLTAWAVNQLTRDRRQQVEALFEAGDRLRAAQADLLAGKAQREALRDAVEAERGAVARLTEEARSVLSAGGQDASSTRLEQISDTLHAAALEDEARAQVKGGRLERELRHVGLGGVAAAAAPRRSPGKRPASQKPRSSPEARKGEAQARDEAGRQRKEETEARARMKRAARAVEAAEERLDRAAERLREAEQRLAAAREVLARATHDHRRAQAALAKAQR
jgi:hypothetical protein